MDLDEVIVLFGILLMVALYGPWGPPKELYKSPQVKRFEVPFMAYTVVTTILVVVSIVIRSDLLFVVAIFPWINAPGLIAVIVQETAAAKENSSR